MSWEEKFEEGANMKSATTRGIRIEVETEYVPEQSNPEKNYYFFAYHITLKNESQETAQLLSRHWIITNSNGRVEEVQGPGVVGEKPVLEPGQSFDYTSFCPLDTPVGTMQGTYQMVTNSGETFEAKIPVFTLAMEEIVLH